MPNCFQLCRNGAPVPLNAIDEELCNLLGEPVHPQMCVAGWYNIIGVRLACGLSWEEIEKKILDCEYYGEADLLRIIGYLRENFTSSAWAER